jgi:putative F0F1-ATPase subunit (Ca2+/Mg2+ transporter)
VSSPLAESPLFAIGPVPVAGSVLTSFGITAALGVASFSLTRRLSLEPSRAQTAIELVVSTIDGEIRDVMVTVAGMGWTIVVPAVVGFVSGHWLDRRYGTGIVLGAGLGLLGLVLGCRGFASTGPHRDDLALTLGDHPVRGMASQGQQRAVVLALQLGEVGAWRYIARQ